MERGEAGQVALDREFAAYGTFRAGKLSRMKTYLSHAQAIEAAGLGE